MTPAEVLRCDIVRNAAYPLWVWAACFVLGVGFLVAIAACWMAENVPARITIAVMALIDFTALMAIGMGTARCRTCSQPLTLIGIDLTREEALTMVARARQCGVRLTLPRDGWFRVCERFRMSGYVCEPCRLVHAVGIIDPDVPSPP
jgi:hypothetical protein